MLGHPRGTVTEDGAEGQSVDGRRIVGHGRRQTARRPRMARKASKARIARIALKGSEKKPLKGAQIVGAARRDDRIEVTVLVRRRQGIPERVLAAATRADVRARKHLSREELREKFGADPADLAQVEAFAENHGLDVVRASRAERMVRLSGSVQAMQ